ncbi:Transmembrane protein 19, partial [Balamuthia mandrillaris]
MTDVLYARAVVGAVMSVLLAAGGYRKKSLNKSGAFAALFVGFITCLAGFRTTITLLLFFFSSSYLTKLKAKEKRKIEENFKEGGQRNWVQV